MSSADGSATARFLATIPGDGSSPLLDLAAEGKDLKVSSTHKYIPAGRLGAKTLEWFDHAFVDGRVTAADFTYKGSVRDFPFRKDEGLFLVRGHVEDAVFDYQPGWIPASDVTADVEFRNEGMHIHASAANVGGLRVTDATADIPDLKETHLRIKAAARGELQDGLDVADEQSARARAGRDVRATERARSDQRSDRSRSADPQSRQAQDRSAGAASRTRRWRCATSMRRCARCKAI